MMTVLDQFNNRIILIVAWRVSPLLHSEVLGAAQSYKGHDVR